MGPEIRNTTGCYVSQLKSVPGNGGLRVPTSFSYPSGNIMRKRAKQRLVGAQFHINEDSRQTDHQHLGTSVITHSDTSDKWLRGGALCKLSQNWAEQHMSVDPKLRRPSKRHT